MVSFCSGYAHANGWVEERYAEVPYFDAAVAGDAAEDGARRRRPRDVMHHVTQVDAVEGLDALVVLLRAPQLHGPVRAAAQKRLSIEWRARDAVDGAGVAGVPVGKI